MRVMLNWFNFNLTRLSIKISAMFCGESNFTLNEVLFYGAEDEEQRKKVGLNNLFCVYNILIHASNSIDICAPSLASATIVKSLIYVKKKGNMKIRIAICQCVDYDNLNTFSKYDIEVKAVRSEIKLEHEFILIDAVNCNDAVAIIGSVDYEVTRVNCNRATTVITSESAVVSTLKREFERIWSFGPEIMKK